MAITNWAGNVTFSSETVRHPRSIEELQDVVAGSDSVRALGTGHSFNRIADTTGTLISVDELDIKTAPDQAGQFVRVGGGVRFGELALALQERGMALGNLGSLPHISVAGACATGTHGSGNTNRCIAATARAVEFVRADGELVHADAGDADFGGTVLALGALGIVTAITLATEATYDVRQDVWVDAPFDSVAENIDEIMASAHSVSVFNTWSHPGTVDQIWLKTRAGAQPADGSRWGGRPATAAMHPITGVDGATATDQFGVPGPWHERLPHFRLAFTPSNGEEQQTEYLLPREHAAQALAAVRSLDLSGVLQIFELRTIASDTLWLSPFRGRDTVALHFTWVDDNAAVMRAVRAVEAAIEPFSPRPHWGKVFDAAPTWHHDVLPAFRALIDAHDPQHKFGNDFLTAHIY